jgi:arylesterase / paraoxonase
MRRTRRAAIVVSAIVFVGILALVLRTFDAMGVFTDVTPMACNDPSLIPGIAGAGDMAFDAPDNSLFIAATAARLWPAHASPADGLYLYRPGGAAAPFKLKGTTADFHPLGLSLFRGADGSLTLMAINMPVQGKPAVDIFDVSDATTTRIALHEREAVVGDLLVSPASIVAVDKSRFYATNDHTSTTSLGHALEIHLMLPRANVVYFDGTDFHVVAKGLRLAAGIAQSPDGSHIYVAETTGRAVHTYSRNAFSGDLASVGELPVDASLDNIAIAPSGDLFVAGEPKLFDFLAFSRDASRPSPSDVFRVAVDDRGVPKAVSLIYSGTNIGAASVGVPVQNRLLIGSAFASKVLSCALRR